MLATHGVSARPIPRDLPFIPGAHGSSAATREGPGRRALDTLPALPPTPCSLLAAGTLHTLSTSGCAIECQRRIPAARYVHGYVLILTSALDAFQPRERHGLTAEGARPARVWRRHVARRDDAADAKVVAALRERLHDAGFVPLAQADGALRLGII